MMELAPAANTEEDEGEGERKSPVCKELSVIREKQKEKYQGRESESFGETGASPRRATLYKMLMNKTAHLIR